MGWRFWSTASLLLLGGSQPALAADHAEKGAPDRVHVCIAEHVDAQLLRKRKLLVEAQERLLECAQPTCPTLLRNECTALEQEVEAALPSVVLSAVDAGGEPPVDVRASIDGSSRRVALDGRPVALNPGEHRLRFEQADGEFVEVNVLLAEFEHARPVRATFPTKTDSARPRRQRRWPDTVLLVSGAVATGALGSFTYFALSGHAVQSDLERCKPHCDDFGQIDRMRSRYLIADVSLGIALLSAGVGVYAWTARPSGPSSGSAQAPTRIALSVPIATSGSLGLWATGEF
jgi:hypothetical protein